MEVQEVKGQHGRCTIPIAIGSHGNGFGKTGMLRHRDQSTMAIQGTAGDHYCSSGGVVER
jgi:hypothetical protein